ncbi:flippase-like domain-containing protein [bacterium]|nr:flippase-like domain-containing protein [candidate division CSSED10-310 bacterium]
MKKTLILLIKILFSSGLIIFLFTYGNVDALAILREFKEVKITWLLLGASLHLTGLLLSSWRWKILLKAQDITQKIGKLFSYYLVGHFFNMFLPTRVGGDIIRVYDTGRDHGSAAQPLAVILVERISGMLTMLFLAACVLMINIDIGFDIRQKVPGLEIYIAVFLAGLLAVPLFFHPRIERLFFNTLLRLPIIQKLEPFARKVYQAFRIFGGKPGYLVSALAVGTILQLNYFLHYYFLAKALDIDLPLFFFFVVIPVRTVALMVPVSLGGIGIRENVDRFAFGFVNPGLASKAVAFSELAWSVQIAFALIGGIIYSLRYRHASHDRLSGEHRPNGKKS